MILLHVFKFFVVYSFIKLFVFCEFIGPDDETTFNGDSESGEEENSVLDSVYDTMRHNYQIKLQQNLDKLNLISDIRNKRNINEPMNFSPMNVNAADHFKNHQYEVNRKNPVNFPLGFKSPPRLMPVSNLPPPVQHRSDYEYEEYHRCNEKPSVQTFHISDNEEKHHHPGISAVLLTGLKYLIGGFAILALPFIVIKALLLPLKVLFFFKAFALIKSFFLLTLFLRFLRLNRRFGLNNNNNNFNNGLLGFKGQNKHKLQTIKDILNSETLDEEEDADYKSEDEDVISKENVSAPMFLNNPFNSSEATEEFITNLVKLVKLKNKKW